LSTPELDALVVGAGIAGLAAALELESRGCEVVVLDPADRPGGVMRTDHVAGYVVERGPNTFQLKARMRGLLERRRLSDALLAAAPASRHRFLQRDGALVPVPLSPAALIGTPLLSTGAKLRMLLEPFVRRGDGEGESVAEFMGRRLGTGVVDGLVGPFLTGIYAGDEGELGAAAVFPSLVEFERRAGSIAFGGLRALFGRGGERGLRGTWSAQEGLGPFARHLAEALAEPPALGSRVVSLAPDAGRWRVEVASAAGEQSLSARRVVVAAPAYDAARILRAFDAEIARALEAVRYAPIVGIPLGIDPGDARERIEGFGFLVPREEELGLLGCLFMSRLFPGRAPEGRELLQCLLGGVRWPEAVELPDDLLLERLAADLDRSLGLRDLGTPLGITRWPRAVPQPARDHTARMDWIHAALADTPGIALAGSYVAGVGVADSLASGLAAVDRLSAERSTP
jgi:oxygen-dependent protoporphyrinogen oxidase